MLLTNIRVLYRQPDSMALWGIPYEMRPGQSPRNIWEGRRVNESYPSIGVYRSRSDPGPGEEWFWLGCPGWWGNLSPENQRAIQEFLAPLRAVGAIPEGPAEWSRLAEYEETST